MRPGRDCSDGQKRRLERRIEKAKQPRSPYQESLLAGVVLCILGGALFIASAVMSWAQVADGSGITTSRTIADLTSLAGKFVILWIVPFAGIALTVSAVSQMTLRVAEAYWKMAVSVATIASSVIGTVFVVLSVFWVQEDVISPAASGSVFGPGVFLAVFGSVLAIAGSIIVFAMAVRAEESVNLPARWAKSREVADEKEYVLPPEPKGKAKGKGPKCPKCGAQIRADWEECPMCGEELH